ncbi:hypothetical protein CVO96_08595 [Deinococcus koreensis]|uniref:Uncharacterized protein n=1 Tax=Deinococcus koreensis TaxID=2054903 RepID=A0A2K3UY12_9DEIO|nr:hypothetical protein CVO96_08595 [Deinococcus koreensis]
MRIVLGLNALGLSLGAVVEIYALDSSRPGMVWHGALRRQTRQQALTEGKSQEVMRCGQDRQSYCTRHYTRRQ